MVSRRVEHYRLQQKRKDFLQKAVARSWRSRSSLELIVEVEAKKKDAAASGLERFARLTHVFEFIPYISFECDRKDAQGVVYGSSVGYAELGRLFKGIEASSEFSVPLPKNMRKARVSGGEVWNLANIGAYEARKHSQGEGVSIAVIDTGVEYSHPEVMYNFESVKGYDFVEGSDNPVDRNGHGTHVAGICAGQSYGVATGSTLYAVRVLDENGSGSESDIIAGIEWCIKNNIDVANMSLGSPVASSAFEEICYAAAGKGLVLVAAAGNNGGEFAMYPAAFGEPVIAVAAVDRYNRHADFSNVFITNDVSAPGVDVTSSYIGGSYATLSGTSMASPHVAGSIALALPLLRSRGINEVLESSAQDIGADRAVFGAGLVRADSMVESSLQSRSGYGLLKAVGRILW